MLDASITMAYLGGLCGLIAVGLLLLALAVAIKAFYHDRAKGRARCRRCWYPLQRDVLKPCPECGTEPRTTADLYRTRRSKRWACIALMLVVLACSIWYWPHVQYRRQVLGEPWIRALVPTTYMIWALPYTDENEWVALCERVSGKPVGGLFGTSSSPQPSSIAPLLHLSPDPIHIGYVEVDPDYTYNPNSLFFTGPYVPEQMVWRWQGRYLLDQFLAIANDDDEAMPERLGAFYLYTGYCGYTRIEHFKRALPLLRGEHGDAFLRVNDPSLYWGADYLDPRLVVDQLEEIYLNSPDDLIEEFYIVEALAMTGNPALDVIEKCWASKDRAMQERGASLLQELCSTIKYALEIGDHEFRNNLDAKRLVEVIRWAATDGKQVLGNSAYNAIGNCVDFYPRTIYSTPYPDEEEPEYEFHQPDAFFISITEHLLDWVIAGYLDQTLVVDNEAPLLESFWMFGMTYVPRDHDLWWDVLDQTDRLLQSDDEDVVWLALGFYDPIYDPGYEWMPFRLTAEHKQRYIERLSNIQKNAKHDYVIDQIDFVIEELEKPERGASGNEP